MIIKPIHQPEDIDRLIRRKVQPSSIVAQQARKIEADSPQPITSVPAKDEDIKELVWSDRILKGVQGGGAGAAGRYVFTTVNDFSGLSQPEIAKKLMTDYSAVGVTKDSADILAKKIEGAVTDPNLRYVAISASGALLVYGGLTALFPGMSLTTRLAGAAAAFLALLGLLYYFNAEKVIQ